MESIISDFDSIICLLKPLALVLFPFIFSILFFSLLGLFGSIFEDIGDWIYLRRYFR